MLFSQTCYSVLVVSASDRFNDALRALLPASGFLPVRVVGSVSAARRAAAERDYDLMVVNTPLPDDFGSAFAAQQSGNRQTVVMLLVRAAQQEELHSQLVESGVFTLAKPTTTQALQTALQWMSAARERLRRVEAKTRSVEEKMEEIRLLNRAKWLLIETRGMREAEAHRYLEKQAMDRCLPKSRIAEELIAEADAQASRAPTH